MSSEKPEIFRLPHMEDGVGQVQDNELAEDDAPGSCKEYEERYVAFIDILGFREIIKESANSSAGASALGSIFNAMSLDFSGFSKDYSTRMNSDDDSHDLRVNTFSDFVVISCKGTPTGLDVLCFVVWCVARDWLSKGYLSRGGICSGKVIHVGGNNGNPGLVFGPAFISAYELEQEVADYPRVVLAKKVRKDLISCRSNIDVPSIAKLVKTCDDGPMYIDLFAHLRSGGYEFLGKDFRGEALQFNATLKSQVEHGADVPRWHRKTIWLVEKFNEAVRNTTYADLTIDRYA